MWPQWYRTLDGAGRRAFWTSFAGFSLDALDVQLYAFVMPTLLAIWGLSHAEAGLLASVTLVASAVGGWAGGLLADRVGRIRVLTLTILWLAVSTCLCGFAQGFGQLLAARALQGLGFGAEWAAGAVFVAEMASPDTRARVVGMVQSAWAVGWGLAATISAIALALLPPDLGWRATFIVGFLPAILLFLVRRRMADTDTFLKARGASPWHTIFSPRMLPVTLGGGLLATGMHSGYWAIATWWPVMLKTERGLSGSAANTYFAAIILGSLFGYMAAAWLGDAVGRRATLGSFTLGGLVMVSACTALPLTNLALLVLSVPLGFFALGMFSAIGPVLSELFPTECRGSGLGFSYNFGRGMAGATALFIGFSIERTGIAHAIGSYAACAYALVLLVTIVLPETRRRDLNLVPDGA